MNIIHDIDTTQLDLSELVLTIGSFDGVHLGHCQVIQQVIAEARARQGVAAVLTMRPHPRELFSPDHPPNLLTCEQKKIQLLKEAGIDTVLILPFTRAVAELDRKTFVEKIIHRCCHAQVLIVGHDFRFGRQAQGDFEYLREIGPEFGFTTRQIPPLFVDGERVSSTLIRERVLEGDLEGIERYLGRPYSLVGQVVSGRGIGTELGFPTANIEPHHNAIPAHGVYAAEACLGQHRIAAAVNIGIAPTIRQEDLLVEAHLLDCHQDLRGQEIEIILHKRLRAERKFASREELQRQIERDIHDIRAYFEQKINMANPVG